MAEILSRGLASLGSLFQIKGSQISTDQLDLSSIQLVSDVGSVLKEGRGLGPHGGWGYLESNNDHTATLDVANLMELPTGIGFTAQNGWPAKFPDTHRLWIYDVGVYQLTEFVASTLTTCRITLQQSVTSIAGVTAAGSFQPGAALFNGIVLGAGVASGSHAARPILNEITPAFPIALLPDLTNGLIGFRSVVTAITPTVLRMWLRVRAIPKGLDP